jgi:hypothetical protein
VHNFLPRKSPRRAASEQLAADELDHDRVIGTDTLPPHATQPRVDLCYAVSVLIQQAA